MASLDSKEKLFLLSFQIQRKHRYVHLVGFILVGRVSRKAFRILGLGERKGRWAMEQDFMEIFRSMLHGFLPLSPVSLTELCSFWYGFKDLFTLHKLVYKVCLFPCLLKLMMSQAVEGTGICRGRLQVPQG